MAKTLADFKDDLAREAYGQTAAEAKAQGICLRCRKPPVSSTEAGAREYRISALCEPCYDEIAVEMDDAEA